MSAQYGRSKQPQSRWKRLRLRRNSTVRQRPHGPRFGQQRQDTAHGTPARAPSSVGIKRREDRAPSPSWRRVRPCEVLGAAATCEQGPEEGCQRPLGSPRPICARRRRHGTRTGLGRLSAPVASTEQASAGRWPPPGSCQHHVRHCTERRKAPDQRARFSSANTRHAEECACEGSRRTPRSSSPLSSGETSRTCFTHLSGPR